MFQIPLSIQTNLRWIKIIFIVARYVNFDFIASPGANFFSVNEEMTPKRGNDS